MFTGLGIPFRCRGHFVQSGSPVEGPVPLHNFPNGYFLCSAVLLLRESVLKSASALPDFLLPFPILSQFKRTELNLKSPIVCNVLYC
jgi:hypothetical protein